MTRLREMMLEELSRAVITHRKPHDLLRGLADFARYFRGE
jgi:hypothetical protein